MKIKICIILFTLLSFLTSCEPYTYPNVKITKGYYDSVKVIGFNGYEPSSYEMIEEDGKVTVTIVFENMKG